MSSIRSRSSLPIQLFIVVLYVLTVVLVKHIYDNNQRNKRFEKYNVTLNEVAQNLEAVERHAKETAKAVRAIEADVLLKKMTTTLKGQTNLSNLGSVPP